jgi:hypothetical protein
MAGKVAYFPTRAGDILGSGGSGNDSSTWNDGSGNDSSGGNDGGGASVLNSGGATSFTPNDYSDPSSGEVNSGSGGGGLAPSAPSTPSSGGGGSSGIPTWALAAGAGVVGLGLIIAIAKMKKRRPNPSSGWSRGVCGGLPRKRKRRRR